MCVRLSVSSCGAASMSGIESLLVSLLFLFSAVDHKTSFIVRNSGCCFVLVFVNWLLVCICMIWIEGMLCLAVASFEATYVV